LTQEIRQVQERLLAEVRRLHLINVNPLPLPGTPRPNLLDSALDTFMNASNQMEMRRVKLQAQTLPGASSGSDDVSAAAAPQFEDLSGGPDAV
jgi:hypothetical protein